MKTGCGFGLHPVFRYFFPFSVGIGFADAKPFTRGKNKKGLSAFIKSNLPQSLFFSNAHPRPAPRDQYGSTCGTRMLFVCDCEIGAKLQTFYNYTQ